MCDCAGSVYFACGGGAAGPTGCDNICGSTLENDECGVCGGDGIADGNCDCDGNVDLGCGCGGAAEDACGVCGGDNSSCLGCTDSSAYNFDPDATLNDGSCIPYGDVNTDGIINVMDIVMMIDFILYGSGLDDMQQTLGDVNTDGIINVLDIVILIEQILGGQLSRGISTSNAIIYFGNGNLQFKADGDIAGIEMAVSGDFKITNSSLPAGWEISHSESVIILYSMDGSSLDNSTLFEYEGDFTVYSTVVADWYESIISVSNVEIPKEFALLPAYPNPFNPVTNINFTVPVECDVTIEIYNIQGRKVTSLLSSSIRAGSHSLVWDANIHTSGLYFMKMTSNEFTQFQKIMLLK